MNTSLVILSVLGFCAAVAVAVTKGPMRVIDIALAYVGFLAILSPKIFCGFFVAAAVPLLIPREVFARWLGKGSGNRGLAMASLLGALVPGGPTMIFPLAVSFKAAGAGTATLIAFVTSWCLLGVNRTVIWEMSFLPWDYVALRVLVCLPFPFVVGWVAGESAEVNILIGTIVLMMLAGFCWQKLETRPRRMEALAGVRRMTVNTVPLLVIALISAGLFAELLPEPFVRQHLGDTAGLTGVLLGTLFGVLTPGGGFVSFALAAGAIEAGAAYPAIVAYITSWGMLAITKLLAEELAFLGPKFILNRVLFSLPVPIACGMIALLIQ